MGEKQDLQGHVLAFFTVFIWGTTFVATKLLLTIFSPVEIMFTRFVLGFFVLLIIGKGTFRCEKLRYELYFMLAGLSGVTLYYLMENIALTYASASIVGVLVSIAPLFTVFFASFFLKEHGITKPFLIGFLLALAGILMVSLSGLRDMQLHPMGILLSVLAAIAWSVYSVTVRKISAFGHRTVQVTARIFFWGVLFLVPVTIWDGFKTGLGAWLEPKAFAALMYLSVVACAVCFVTWNRAVSILGATKTSVYVYAVPVINIVCSMLVLRETLTPIMICGSVLTIAGLVVSQRKPYMCT